MNKFYSWTVRISIAARVVADGFNLDDSVARDMLGKYLSLLSLLRSGRNDPAAVAAQRELIEAALCRGDYMSAEVTHAPPPIEIAREQGYETAEAAGIRDVDYSERQRRLAEIARETVVAFIAGGRARVSKEDAARLTAMIAHALHHATGVPREEETT
jgi:hypothetical protein